MKKKNYYKALDDMLERLATGDARTRINMDMDYVSKNDFTDGELKQLYEKLENEGFITSYEPVQTTSSKPPKGYDLTLNGYIFRQAGGYSYQFEERTLEKNRLKSLEDSRTNQDRRTLNLTWVIGICTTVTLIWDAIKWYCEKF